MAEHPPRYRIVADLLADRIAGGTYPVGSLLPGEQALAAECGVARGTVRSALAHLARRGAVASRPGAGWMVQSSLHTQGLASFGSFAQWARSRGMEPGGRAVARERTAATAEQARMLRIPQGSELLGFIRLRTLDGQVVMIERSLYPGWLAPVLSGVADDAVSHAEILAEAGHGEAFGSHHIDAVAASSDDARLLGVRRSSPLLRVRRQAYARDGRPLDFSEDRYLPGVVSFEAASSASGADGAGAWSRSVR